MKILFHRLSGTSMYMEYAADVLTFILCTQSSVCILFYKMAFDGVCVLRGFVKGEVL